MIQRFLHLNTDADGLDIVWHGLRIYEVYRLIPFSLQKLSLVDDASDAMVFSDVFLPWREAAAVFARTVNGLGLPSIWAKFPEMEEPLTCASKYYFALCSVVEGLCLEGTIDLPSLPYLGEACSDFYCSLMLLRGGFFCQALQLLRSSLEAAACHAYFATQDIDFFTLEASSKVRSQPLKVCGDKGILAHLNKCRLVSEQLLSETATSYAVLSRQLHSRIQVLCQNAAARFYLWVKHAVCIGRFALELALGLLRADCLYNDRCHAVMCDPLANNLTFNFFNECRARH